MRGSHSCVKKDSRPPVTGLPPGSKITLTRETIPYINCSHFPLAPAWSVQSFKILILLNHPTLTVITQKLTYSKSKTGYRLEGPRFSEDLSLGALAQVYHACYLGGQTQLPQEVWLINDGKRYLSDDESTVTVGDEHRQPWSFNPDQLVFWNPNVTIHAAQVAREQLRNERKLKKRAHYSDEAAKELKRLKESRKVETHYLLTAPYIRETFLDKYLGGMKEKERHGLFGRNWGDHKSDGQPLKVYFKGKETTYHGPAVTLSDYCLDKC